MSAPQTAGLKRTRQRRLSYPESHRGQLGAAAVERLRRWVGICAAAVVVAGAGVAFLDLTTLPVKGSSVLPWVTAMLGATMMGWGVTVFFVARYALRVHSGHLVKATLLGIATWFVVDTAFSAFLGVYFNCAINVIVLAALGYPLLSALRRLELRGGAGIER